MIKENWKKERNEHRTTKTSLETNSLSAILLGCCLAFALFTTAPMSITYAQKEGTLSQTGSYPANAMWIEPSTVGVDFSVGRMFNVTIWVNLDQSSFTWQIALRFDKTYLSATRAAYTGPGRSDFFNGGYSTIPVTPVIDNSSGVVYHCESLLGNDARAAGSGSLCWIEFQVVAPTGETTLSLDSVDSFVIDPDLNDIPFTRYDATVYDIGQPGAHPANAMWIEPLDFNISFTVGTTFTVTTWANLTQPNIAWQFRMRFDTQYLNASRSGYTGPGTSDFYNGYTTIPLAPIIDNTQGFVMHAEALLGSEVHPGGSGSLSWVEFQVVAPADETVLYFDAYNDMTLFLDPDTNFIPFTGYAAVVRNGTTAPTTLMLVNPSVSTVGLNRPFTVNVNISNVSDLYNWELKLYYQKAILSFTGAVEGDFLQSEDWNTMFVDNSDPNYNDTCGMIYIGASIIGEIPGVNGTGTVASIGFTAISMDNSSLILSETMLLNSQLQDILHGDVNGFVIVGSGNICVSSVSPDKDVVGQGYCMNISVCVLNEAAFNEAFNVAVYVNTTMIGTQLANVAPDGNLTLTFVWNTTGYSRGIYVINGTADTIPDETNLEDNTLVNGTVHVGIAGEITGLEGVPDGTVNMFDIGTVCRVFGVAMGNSRYVPECDINNDGQINMRDIGIVCRNFLKTS